MKHFQFKEFRLRQDRAAMKVGTDSTILGAWVQTENVGKGLDIGTGTGILSLMLAQRYTNLQIDAIEPDPGSFADALENFGKSPWFDRLELHQQTLQNFTSADRKAGYDLIISNPPYFEPSPFNSINPVSNARQTNQLTHPLLIQHAASLLSEQGKLNVILPVAEAIHFRAFAERQGLYCSKLCQVKTHENKEVRRHLMEFQKGEQPCQVSELTILRSNTPNDYTEEYRNLVKPFYLFL
ncbi:MAG: methyltransferase [Saprospiraceae bacterium]|nr:methyltransferase [Saprospiraceae bacterium]